MSKEKVKVSLGQGQGDDYGYIVNPENVSFEIQPGCIAVEITKVNTTYGRKGIWQFDKQFVKKI